MKATQLISRLQHLVKHHGDIDVLMDVDCHGPHQIGEVVAVTIIAMSA